MDKLFDELIEGQRKKLLALGRRLIPHLTEDDLLQPNDFPALENNPHFRHEEGILDGILMSRAAIRADVPFLEQAADSVAESESQTYHGAHASDE